MVNLLNRKQQKVQGLITYFNNKQMKKKTVIISLGGSLVVPNEIDISFLKKLKICLTKYFNNNQFIVFVGGGKVCRRYQKALQDFGAKNKECDWMGIKISRLNAEIVKQVFEKNSDKEVVANPTKKIISKKGVVVGAGFLPGHSTDYDAVLSAKANSASTVINLSNIDYVFDKDPLKFPNARALDKINWPDFRKLVGDKWTPGFSSPFDPTASKLAEKIKLKVIIINGKYLNRLEDFLNNKPFIGTTIQ